MFEVAKLASHLISQDWLKFDLLKEKMIKGILKINGQNSSKRIQVSKDITVSDVDYYEQTKNCWKSVYYLTLKLQTF